MHLTAIGQGSVLLEPGMGLDPSNPDLYFEAMVSFIQSKDAGKLIYDLQNVSLIDEVYYNWLVHISRLCNLSGVSFIVANMQPAAAFALSSLISDSPPFKCALDVDRARKSEII